MNESTGRTKEDAAGFILPVGPSDLCFDRNEFLEESFSVDKFLHDHKKKAYLETIRDDLGIYLKVLRSAMIELINKDYADFVNLSSNLIGLDKAIHNIYVPLGQLKEEILQVKQTLGESMTDVSEQLKRRRSLHTTKQTLISLSYIQKMLQKLEDLVHNADKPLKTSLIERGASEYNRLQFAMTKTGPYQNDSDKKKILHICEILTHNLNRTFLDAVKSEKPSEIAHCLRIYVILGRISYVEDLLRKEIIAVILSDVISENFLNSNPNGLMGVYHSILKIVDEDMLHLLNITSGKSCEVAGFDFIVNSFWPEVEYRLEVNLSSIYAPGNPEIFYKRFCETMEFLNALDQRFKSPDHIKVLHSHSQYKSFMELWNLPVYFQIRFQEIAGSFETTLCNSKAACVVRPDSDFHIASTCALWSCITQCWADGVFLNQLGHRFWKLTLQLLARYTIWVDEVLNEKKDSTAQSVSSEEIGMGSNNASSSGSDKGITFLVYLYLDMQTLLNKIPKLEEEVVQKLNGLSSQGESLIKRSLDESKEGVRAGLPRVGRRIVEGVSGASVGHVRQVSDIPRLFRRTNRDVPTKACAYVAQALQPCVAFRDAHQHAVDAALLRVWLAQSASAITQHYYNAVSDVLTSVQKTEESLQRLKKIKGRSSTSTVEMRGSGGSDDDKIRKQLVIDVQSYCSGIIELGLKQQDVDKLDELLTMVSEASSSLKEK